MITLAKAQRKRDRGNGRYAPSKDALCTCGHRLGAHTAVRVSGEQPCLNVDFCNSCPCEVFTKAKKL